MMEYKRQHGQHYVLLFFLRQKTARCDLMNIAHWKDCDIIIQHHESASWQCKLIHMTECGGIWTRWIQVNVKQLPGAIKQLFLTAMSAGRGWTRRSSMLLHKCWLWIESVSEDMICWAGEKTAVISFDRDSDKDFEINSNVHIQMLEHPETYMQEFSLCVCVWGGGSAISGWHYRSRCTAPCIRMGGRYGGKRSMQFAKCLPDH